MANVRLNIFENVPLLHTNMNFVLNVNTLSIQGVYIPGSISFNKLAVIVSGSGAVSQNLSLSFGLYSLNGSTLSLANSASRATALTLNQTMFSWLSFATSATQDITPGNWYLAYMNSTALGAGFSLVKGFNVLLFTEVQHQGLFVRGAYSVTTSAFPASIATSDM